MTSYTFSSSGDNNDLHIFQNSSSATVSETALLSDGQSVNLVAMQNNINKLDSSVNSLESSVNSLESSVNSLDSSVNVLEPIVADLNEQNRKNRMANAIVKHRRTKTSFGTPFVFDSTNYWPDRNSNKNLVIYFCGSGSSLDGEGTMIGIEKLSQTKDYGGIFSYYAGTEDKNKSYTIPGDFGGSTGVDVSDEYQNEVNNVKEIINKAESEIDSSFDNITVVGVSKGGYLVNSLFASQHIPKIKNYIVVAGQLDPNAVVYNDLSFVSDASDVTYINIYDIDDPYFGPNGGYPNASKNTWNKYVNDLSSTSLGDISNITLLMENSLTDLSSSHNFTVIDISGYSYANNNRIINIETNNTTSDIIARGIGSGTLSVKHVIGLNNHSSTPAPYSDIVLGVDGISDVVPELIKILYNN